MADFTDVVEEIKNTNKKLDDFTQASDLSGASATEEKRDAALQNELKVGYLKTIAEAVTGGGGGAAAGKEEAKKGGLLAGIGGALSGLGIGAGAAMGGLGALFAGGGYLIKQLMDFDGKKVYNNVKELLKINDLFDGPMDALKESGSFFIAMTAISGGLVALGIGSAVGAGGTALAKFMGGDDWTQTIVDNVETLLSMDVATDVAGQFAEDMAFISAGLIAFAIGSTFGSAATGIDDAIGMFTNKGKKDGTGKGTGWAKSIKDNLETLLTIKIGTLTEAANLAATMGMLGAGLFAFSIGSATGAAATGIDQAISMFVGNKQGQGTGWAEKGKSEVETLLSIQTGSILDTAKLVATLGAIGLGLIVFSLGKVVATGAEGAASAFSPSEEERKDGHEKFSKTGWAKTIVAEVTELMKIGQLSFFDAAKFVGTMGLIGLGLVAFSAGKVAAGAAEGVTATVQDVSNSITQFSNSGFAQTIVDEVTTLLSIANMPLGDAAEFVTTMGLIGLGLVAFSAGKAASGTAEIVNRLAGIGTEGDKSFAQKIKEEVVTLLSIVDLENVNMAKADLFSDIMGTLSVGMLKFSASDFIGSLAAGTGAVIGFLTGTKSPVTEMINIANKADDLTKGADALDKISESLSKIGNLNFNGNKIKIKEFAKDLIESIPAIEAAIMGGKIESGWWSSDIVYKGLASQDIKWNEAAQNIDLLMQSLNPQTSINAQRTAQMQQASLQNSVNGMGGGQSVITNMPVSNVSTNQSNTTVTSTPLVHQSPVLAAVNSSY